MSRRKAQARGAPPRPSPAKSAGRRSGARAPWRSPALLAAIAAALLYLPTLGDGFVWDDHSLIEHHLPQVAAHDLPHLVTSDFWMVTGGQSGFWRPAIGLSYWVDGRLSGFRPGWFHAVNLLAHALAAACLVMLLEALAVPALAAGLAGLWFGTLPLHVEAVAWISGRADVISTLFVLLALALEARAGAGGVRRAAAVAAFAAGLLCKESAVLALPVVAALRWTRDRERAPAASGVVRALVPYAAVTAIYLIVHARLAPTPGAPGGATAAVLAEVRRAAWTAFPRSLAFLLPWFPHGAEQVLVRAGGTPPLAVAAGIAVHLLAAAGAVVLLARRSPWAAPLLLTWLPALPPLYAMLARGEPLYAERLFLLSSAGVAWAIGLALARVQDRVRVAAFGGVIVLVLAGSWATLAQLPAWRADEPLYRSIVARSPRSARAHIGLAEVLAEQGRDADAAAEYDRAGQIQPWLPYVHVGRSLLYFRRARWSEMLGEADRALALDSLDLNGRLLRATALLRLRRPDDALRTLAPVRALREHFPPYDGAWGQALMMLGRTAEAIPYLESAARWIPDDADLSFALATAYSRERRFADARGAYQRTLEIDPGYYDAWLRLALACQLTGDVAGRDQALARAAALPQASDGRVEALRRELEVSAPGGP